MNVSLQYEETKTKTTNKNKTKTKTNKNKTKTKTKQKQKRINYIFRVRQINSLITDLLGNFSFDFW